MEGDRRGNVQVEIRQQVEKRRQQQGGRQGKRKSRKDHSRSNVAKTPEENGKSND